MLLAKFSTQSRGNRGLDAYQLDRTIPRAGSKRILCNQVPGSSINLARVLMPVLHWRITRSSGVKQLDSAISTSYNELVLIQLRPSGVIDCILSVETGLPVSPFPGFAPPDCRIVKSGEEGAKGKLTDGERQYQHL